MTSRDFAAFGRPDCFLSINIPSISCFIMASLIYFLFFTYLPLFIYFDLQNDCVSSANSTQISFFPIPQFIKSNETYYISNWSKNVSDLLPAALENVEKTAEAVMQCLASLTQFHFPISRLRVLRLHSGIGLKHLLMTVYICTFKCIDIYF